MEILGEQPGCVFLVHCPIQNYLVNWNPVREPLRDPFSGSSTEVGGEDSRCPEKRCFFCWIIGRSVRSHSEGECGINVRPRLFTQSRVLSDWLIVIPLAERFICQQLEHCGDSRTRNQLFLILSRGRNLKVRFYDLKGGTSVQNSISTSCNLICICWTLVEARWGSILNWMYLPWLTFGTRVCSLSRVLTAHGLMRNLVRWRKQSKLSTTVITACRVHIGASRHGDQLKFLPC